MKLILPALCIAMMTSVAVSCSCSKEKHGEAADGPEEPIVNMVVAPRDSDLYEMGRRHAAYIINNHTHVDSIGEQLLEIRARESELRRRIDEVAARTYIYGVERYIRENAPALADSIL